MRTLLTFLLLLLLASPAMAAGFHGPTSGNAVDTVAQALKAADDTPVVLTGNIVSREAGSDDKYMFRDSTGTMLVEIDHKRFAGRDVTPSNEVRISGEVDKELLKPTKIDVKILEILK